MKRRFTRLFLGISYIAVVTVLLLLHIQMITGQVQRIMATLETILLVIPTIIIMGLYIRNKENIASKAEKEEKLEQGVIPDIQTFEQFEKSPALCDLSEREFEVAWLLYRGYTNRQIAEELFIAESTVKKHVSHIYEKAQVSRRNELKEKVKTGINEVQ